MTILIYNVAKAPLGWSIYRDGIKIGGVFGSKAGAFEAAAVAASFDVQVGLGVQINVPDAPALDEIPREWIAAIKSG